MVPKALREFRRGNAEKTSVTDDVALDNVPLITSSASSFRSRRSTSSTHSSHKFSLDDPSSSASLAATAAVEHAAHQANEDEVSMTLREGLHKYPKAIAWSMVISTVIIMEGFDTALLGNFYGFPSFQRKYGIPYGDGYQVPAKWATIMSMSTTMSTLGGLALNGWATEKYGYKPVLLWSLVAISVFIFIPFFSQNMPVLVFGEVLCSLPWGVFQTLTTAYASEVCPVVLRCYLTTYVNLCWVIGQLIAAGVLRSLVTRLDEWAFRIPFALQWVWPLPLIIAISFAPESPWWLVRQGRLEEAERSVRRLASSSVDTSNTIAMIKMTNNLERERNQVGTDVSYAECFRGANLVRTEIACMVWVAQNACGVSFVGWGSYFFQVAGLDPSQAYSLSLGSIIIAFTGTLISWILLTYFGRRTLYLAGLSVMFCIFFTVGCFTLAPASNTSIVWATAGLFYLFHLTFGLTVGPVCYTVVSEIPSTRLRSKTVILARASYIVVGLFTNALTPFMVQETGWNWKYKTGFFWATTCALLVVWCYFRLPEPKGRSYGEMAVLFAKGVPARQWSRTVAEPFEVDDEDGEALMRK